MKMNIKIKAIVEQCPMLHFQVNKGEIHRIMRSGIVRGSLWVTPRVNYYTVTPTGEVATRIYDFMCSHFGAETGEDHKGRWKYWNIREIGDVSKIIRHFGEP